MGDVPLSVISGVIQLITPPVADAPGGVVFNVTEAVAEAVQLFAGLVTVTVYVPADATVGFCWLDVKPDGPLHANVAFGASVPTET